MAEKRLHAIMIAFCYQGHITPFINLAIKLASNGCAITFVHSEFVHHMLSKADGVNVAEADPFLGARGSGLDIRYATISDGFQPDFDRILNFKQHWEAVFLDFPSRVDELIGNIIHSDEASLPFAHFLVADTFYSWPAAIAKKYNILNASFWTQPALVFALDYHLDLLREIGYFTIKGDEENVIIDLIPGIQPIKAKDLMSNFHDLDEASTTKKISPGSVLYVSFGSLAQSNQQLAEEIANGLLLSGVHFVWVIRGGTDVLPDKFENDSNDQGLIVSWCNQIAVISNPAVGGFLTHCGWNSILESIWCGVPMICLDEEGSTQASFHLFLNDLWAKAEAVG